ncbi:hypothetical protein [Streptomyces sp. NPDC093089]|uniref:hypothetical protein n=1 Tax=Streptomyces sp. NPDC093089 TaxID=3366024 RepID=UPI0037F6506D
MPSAQQSLTRRPSKGQDSFARALRAAIETSELGLSQLQLRLEEHGVRISLATLSYWQTGRSRPERPGSFLAVDQIEQILDLQPDSLRGLLGPRRPRGRCTDRERSALPVGALWPERDAVEAAVRDLDLRWDDALERISLHDRLIIGPDRREESFRTRQVLRARRSGPDRCVHIYRLDEPHLPPPEIRPLRGCRPGRVAAHPGTGLLTAELLFDQPLALGETVIVEFELRHRERRPLATHWERKIRVPVRQYDLEIEFAPPALPAAFEHYVAPGTNGSERSCPPVALDAAHRVHAVALDLDPCRYGMRWSWT